MAENNSSAPLLPCPFCGERTQINALGRRWWRMESGHRQDCLLSEVDHTVPQTDEQKQLLIDAWNTRAPQAVAAQAAPATVHTKLSADAGRLAYVADQIRALEPVGSEGDVFLTEVIQVLKDCAALAATPALPATEDSSAGDLAEVQAEPVSSDPVAWHSKLYGTCWMHKQPYHLDAGTHFFVRGNHNPVATVLSGAAIQWHTGTAAFEHGTFFYTAPQAQPADALDWAVQRWNDEVRNRPMVNIHRRSLDDTWRQVITYLGGDACKLVGPSHDDLLAAAQEGGQ